MAQLSRQNINCCTNQPSSTTCKIEILEEPKKFIGMKFIPLLTLQSIYNKKVTPETSQAVQWLRLKASTAGGPDHPCSEN